MTRPRPVAEWERLEYRTLMVLTDHVGRAQATGMGELFEKVFAKPYENRINCTIWWGFPGRKPHDDTYRNRSLKRFC